jgi:general secretion pathway protein K
MTPAAFQAIAPHLAALPGRTAINVNTATPEVLVSLSEAAAGADLRDLLARQRGAPFSSVGEFAADFPYPIPEGIALGVRSDHFALTTTVSIEGLTTTMYSLLARAPEGATRTLRRSVEPEP